MGRVRRILRLLSIRSFIHSRSLDDANRLNKIRDFNDKHAVGAIPVLIRLLI